LIAGLHSAYSQLQTVLLCMKDVTVDDVESALIGAQGLASRRHHTVSDALFVRRQGSASSSTSSGAAPPKKHCAYCHKDGHVEKDCWAKKRKENKVAAISFPTY